MTAFKAVDISKLYVENIVLDILKIIIPTKYNVWTINLILKHYLFFSPILKVFTPSSLSGVIFSF